MKPLNLGVLAFHGDVSEHIETTKKASERLKIHTIISPIRTKNQLSSLDGLIIPGGESTTLYKLCERECMIEDMKNVKFIFGTCAGAILLAKTVFHKTDDQKTLELMDITIDRNAYGRQTESFVKNIKTKLGNMKAIFIRAPKILKVGNNVTVLAKCENQILACEEQTQIGYYLSCCFHPELTSTKFHEYFIRKVHKGIFNN
jgi:pyridoxal 5'-phosphate synthase pdxT subunit